MIPRSPAVAAGMPGSGTKHFYRTGRKIWASIACHVLQLQLEESLAR